MQQENILSACNRVFPYTLISLIIFGAAIGLLIGGREITLLGLLIIVPPFVLSAILHKKYNRLEGGDLPNIKPRPIMKAYYILFFLLIPIIILTDNRPWYFFVIVSLLLSVLVIGSIGFGDKHPKSILISLLLLSIFLSYSVTLNYHYYFGGGGSLFFHYEFSRVTLETGSVIPEELSNYHNFPLYHIFVVASTLIFALPVETSTMVAVPLFMTISTIFVYQIAKTLTKNNILSLLCSTAYISFPEVIYYSSYTITRTLSFVGLVIFLYIWFRKPNSFEFSLCLIPVVLLVILSHQVTIIQLLPVIIFLYVLRSLLKINNKFETIALGILSVVTIAYWTFLSVGYAEYLASLYLSADFYGGSSGSTDTDGSSTGFHHYTYYLYLYMAISTFLIGIGRSIKDSNKNITSIGVISFFLLPLFVPSPLHAIPLANVTFRIDRYLLFISPFISIMISVGILHIVNILFSMGSKTLIKKMISVLLVVLLIISMFSAVTMTDYSTPAADSEDLSWTGPKVHFEPTEKSALNTLTATSPTGSTIKSDWQTTRYIDALHHISDGRFIKTYRSVNDNPLAENSQADITIVRKEAIKQGVRVGEAGNRRTVTSTDFSKLDQNNVIYDNSDTLIMF